MLLVDQDIKACWMSYFQKLYNDPNPTLDSNLPDLPLHPNMEKEPGILVSEVRMAIDSLKKNKAVGIDGISAEEIQAATTEKGECSSTSLSLSLSLFVLRQFSSLARVRRFPTSAMPPQRTILGRLFLQTPLFYRVLYFLLPSLNRSPYPPLPLHYQPPACRYHVPFVLSLQMPKPP